MTLRGTDKAPLGAGLYAPLWCKMAAIKDPEPFRQTPGLQADDQ